MSYRPVKEKNYSETWMGENLNYATAEGSACYDEDEANCDKYGRLYTRDAAQGVCPEGWHLPSKEEFEALVVAVDENITEYSYENTAATALKSTRGWNKDNNGTDAYSFTALPAGYILRNGTYISLSEGEKTGFWSSSKEDNSFWSMMFYDRDLAADMKRPLRTTLHSVRCIKDKQGE